MSVPRLALCCGPLMGRNACLLPPAAGEGASPNHGGLFRVTIPGVKGVAAAYKYPL